MRTWNARELQSANVIKFDSPGINCVDARGALRYEFREMAKFFARKCPRCREYFGVAITHSSTRRRTHSINGSCAECGYRLMGWRLITGGKRPMANQWERMPKVFR